MVHCLNPVVIKSETKSGDGYEFLSDNFEKKIFHEPVGEWNIFFLKIIG